MTDLAQFARQHRVHYDVQPELLGNDDARAAVGFEIRLFATQREARLAAPGRSESVELAHELASFAQQLVSGSGVASRAEVIPAPPALYESADERDVDEVAVTLRVRCDSPDHQRGSGGDDPCAREIRDRLAAVGVGTT